MDPRDVHLVAAKHVLRYLKGVDVFVTSEDILMYIIIVCCCTPIWGCVLPLYGMSKLCLDLEVQPLL